MQRTLSVLIMLSAICIISDIRSQVAINSSGSAPDASAMLDVSSSDKGVLVPRVNLQSTTDVITVPSPALSLLVYNSNPLMSGGGGEGFYFWNGSSWSEVGAPQTLTIACDTLFISGGNYVILPGLSSFGQPSAANAGPNQSTTATTVTLAANTPSVGTGLWTIISGSGGSLANASSPTSSFTGTTGTTYLLEWSIGNSCNVNRDTVQISLISAKYVFVTSGTWNGNLGGLSGADAKCASEATSAGLPGTYVALLSTNSGPVDAVNRITDAAYARVDEVVIGSNRADLFDSSILALVNKSATGATISSAKVWTGTDPDGTLEGQTCNNWTWSGSSSPRGQVGYTHYLDMNWVSEGSSQCDQQARLYCFQL